VLEVRQIKHRYQVQCAQRVYEITFIGYDQYRNIGKPNNLKVFGSNKPRGLNRIATKSVEEENLSFENNYIISKGNVNINNKYI
jgi:hypothetical protein